MVSTFQVENPAQRFTPYIDELREFFSSRRIPFGTPADLAGFAALLDEETFSDEMVSISRSVLYRESEALSRNDLLELVALAVGGPDVEQASEDSHRPMRRLLAFATEVVRPQRFGSIVDAGPEGIVSAPQSAQEPARQEPLHLIIPEDPPAQPADRAASSPTTGADQLARPAVPTNDRLQRILVESQQGIEETTGPGSVPEPSPLLANAAAFSGLPRSHRRGSLVSFLRHAYWIPGACVLALVLAATLYLQKYRQTGAPTAVSSPPLLSTAPQVSKPIAYGPALASTRRPTPFHESARLSGPPSSPLPARHVNGRASSVPASSGSATSARTDASPALPSSKVSPRALGGREGVFLASSGAMASHLLNAPAPNYPRLASMTHTQGEVIVQVVVARDGRVEATRVLEGPHLLRGAAEHAIRRWRYRPYLVEGTPTDVATIVTVNFRLSR